MNVAIWRSLSAVLVGVGLIYGVLDTAIPFVPGDLGFSASTSAMPNGFNRVVAVSAHGSAAGAGVAVGDGIYRNAADLQRCPFTLPHPGDVCSLTVMHDGVTRRIVLRALPGDPGPFYQQAIVALTRISFLLMGTLLLWKRSDDAAARALATFFVSFGIGMGPGIYRLHGLWAVSAGAIAVEALFAIGGAAAVRFATVFPERDDRGVRATLRRMTPFIAAAVIAAGFARIVAASQGVIVNALVNVLAAFWIYVAIAVVASLGLSFRRASGNDRQRLLWVMATFAAGFSGLVVFFICLAFGNVSPYVDLSTLTIVCIPFGLGYVMLRHRLLDITFVINRTLVFAVVSTVVVGVLAILETLLAKYVEAANQITSTVVQLAVALGLGLGARSIHAWVDRFADDILFRERHLAEAALRGFAYDAPFVTDERILLRTSVDLVIRYGRARSAQIWLRTEDDRFAPALETNGAASVDENDAAIVTMRARHISVDLIETHSGLNGTYAFPMTVRGRLIGTLVCGSNAVSETYAPDERALLETVARSVGQALDGLRVRELKREVAAALAGGATFEAARPKLQRLVTSDGLAS